MRQAIYCCEERGNDALNCDAILPQQNKRQGQILPEASRNSGYWVKFRENTGKLRI